MTSSAHSAVPPLAERLLRATVRDAEWRDAVTGDLREEFASSPRARCRRRAALVLSPGGAARRRASPPAGSCRR